MKIAREGYPLIAVPATGAALFLALGWWIVAAILVAAALAIAAFFRDPECKVPSGEGLVVSPADRKVVAIADVRNDPLFDYAATRVSIFLSPLDVHINRVPVTGAIEEIEYKPGKFLAAYKDEASRANEQNVLRMIDEQGRRLGIVQVAGVLARRIVCRVKQGDALQRGQRFGLIMFGSRTDVYLPSDCRVEVKEGEWVKGGESLLGRFV